MNALTALRGGTVPAAFQSVATPDMTGAMQKGLSAGFAVIGYKSSVWRIKHRGDDNPIRDAQGIPMPFLNVIIVGVSENISKQWYQANFTDGDNQPPDCFSIDGVRPDPASPKLQCASCAACPQNVWGSRITEKNKKAKQCRDSRRVAIVPWGDITNEAFGGPMLLRVPTMSLGNLSSYANELKKFGAQPYMVATQLSFDLNASHPLINFQATGYLTDAEAAEVIEMLENPLIERILHSEAEVAADPEGEQIAENVSALAGQAPPAAFTPPPAPPPVAAAPPPPPPPAPPQVAVQAPPAAPAKPTPFTQTAKPATTQAPPAGSNGAGTPGFGGKVAHPAPAPAPQASATVTQLPVQPAPQAAPATVTSGPAAVVSGAPPDMAAAIDSLLDSDD